MSNAVRRVERHAIHKSDTRFAAIDEASFASKDLYNASNYIVRQRFIFENTYTPYFSLYTEMKETPQYRALPAKVAQQVLRGLHNNWRSFFEAIKEWRIAPEKFRGRPKLPGYKKKQGRHLLVYTLQAIGQRILEKKGVLVPSGLPSVEVQTKQAHESILEVRIVPKADHYVVEVVYQKEVHHVEGLHPAWIAGVEVGLNNLAALSSNKPGFVPVLVNGKPIKSINQLYNKRKARLTSILERDDKPPEEGEEKPSSRQLKRMATKRYHRIQHYLHTASRRIVDTLVAEQIGTLVIGKSEDWKQNLNMGKRNNQAFSSVPFARFVDMLRYKAEEVGIAVVLTEESYTSKCSFLDDELPQEREVYTGRRVKRGLFRSSTGKTLNADVQGSCNIVRKVFPEAFSEVEGIGAAVVRARRMSLNAHPSESLACSI